MSTILTGHTLDLAIYLLGSISQLDVMTATKYKSVKLTDALGYVETDSRFFGGPRPL